jgi:hypothetical protein
MEPYKYVDADDDALTIESGIGRLSGAAIVRASDDGVGIRPAGLPVITGKLYEACGLPSPVILERSSARFPEGGKPFRFGVLGFRLYPEGIAPSLPGVVEGPMPPAALRALASHLVALADDAEANPEPDPDEVDELAHAIRLGLYPDSDRVGLQPSESEKKAARAALRWMNAKAARDA